MMTQSPKKARRALAPRSWTKHSEHSVRCVHRNGQQPIKHICSIIPRRFSALTRLQTSIMGLFDKLSRDSKEEERASFSAPTPAAPAPPAYSGGESGHGYPADSKTPIPTPAQSYSSAPQAGFSGSSSQAPGSTYAALLLSRSDRIRIINFPGSIVQPLDAAIKRVWAPGVQQQGAYDQASWEWKLSGRPCEHSRDVNTSLRRM